MAIGAEWKRGTDMKKEESVVNVPLKVEVRNILERQADENGRAMGREAARIIERELMKTADGARDRHAS